MKKRILSLILMIFILFTFVGCKDDTEFELDKNYKYDGVSLVGKWQNANPDRSSYSVYEFEGGGEIYNNVTVITYIYGIEAVRMDATYRVEDGNVLALDYDVSLGLSTERYKFSISNNKVYIDNKYSTILEPYNLNYNEDTSIFGTWRDTTNTDEVWSLRSDYSGLLSDSESANQVYFSTEDNILNLFVDETLPGNYSFSPENVLRYEYKIEGNILTLKLNGKTYTLERE